MFRILLVFATVLLAGCDALQGLSDFEVSASNRTDNTIMFYANGVEQGEIPAGRARAFVVKLTTLSRDYGPTPTAQVTFTARNIVTGKLSREKRMTLSRDRPESIEFNTHDFQ